MKYTRIIVIVLVLLLKTKAGAIGTVDTTQIVHFLSSDPVPTFDPGAYVKGAVYFDNGFELTSTATLPFGSLGTVNGTISLNNGTLKLTRDLYLGSNVTLLGPGFIDLDAYSIYFSDYTDVQDTIFVTGQSIYENKFIGNGNTLSVSNGRITYSAGYFFIEGISITGIHAIDANTPNFEFIDLIAIDSSFSFDDTAGSTIYFTPRLQVDTACKICGPNQCIVCGEIRSIHNFYNLTITDGTTFRVLTSIYGTTFDYPFKIMLNNARLEFTGPTPQMDGVKLEINGVCSLYSVAPLSIPGGNGSWNVLIKPASTLIIDDHTTITDNSTK